MNTRAFGLALVALAGCSTRYPFSRDHDDHLGKPHEKPVELTDVPVRGFRAAVQAKAEETPDVVGELLAVDRQNIFVETEQGSLKAVPRTSVKNVRIVVFTTKEDSYGYGLWTGIGALSAASHGIWAVISVPVWLAVGLPIALAARNGEAIAEAAPEAFDLLYQWARYPQGLPPTMRVAPVGSGSPATSP